VAWRYIGTKSEFIILLKLIQGVRPLKRFLVVEALLQVTCRVKIRAKPATENAASAPRTKYHRTFDISTPPTALSDNLIVISHNGMF
jgi:hypothetical protein